MINEIPKIIKINFQLLFTESMIDELSLEKFIVILFFFLFYD
jgi:hypothetical protein